MKKQLNSKTQKKLKVFEAFAGIGAQHSALKRANINFKIVGISEWFINALLVYNAIHNDHIKDVVIPSYEEQIEELKKYTFSRDSVHPIKDIKKLSRNEIENLYVANKNNKNFGSITEIKGKDLPEIDLFVYSFPCQDLSTGGNTLGMSKGSGTRSGLLWEVERILLELKAINKLPEYLLMENVKTIYAKSNKKDLDQWLTFLESIGYKNGSKMILDSIDFGVPQVRKRAFIISHLNTTIDDTSLINYSAPLKPLQDFLRTDYNNEELREEANEAQLNRTDSRQTMWKINRRDVDHSTSINTITCNMDRSNTAAMFKYDGPKGNTYRLLTMREAFLLMGFTEKEYRKTQRLRLSYRKMNKLIGNSIVVDVLTEIFSLLFKEKYGKGE
jgi:DNA (cytosine-5)-methyltransferase 1